MIAHKIEGETGEYDARIPCVRSPESLSSARQRKKNVFFCRSAAPMRFGTNRKTFSGWAVARSTAYLASTTSKSLCFEGARGVMKEREGTNGAAALGGCWALSGPTPDRSPTNVTCDVTRNAQRRREKSGNIKVRQSKRLQVSGARMSGI